MHAANTHIGAMVGALTREGLGVRLNPDPQLYRDFARKMEGHDPASPLDTTFVKLNTRSFFWIHILDSHRDPIAACAARVIHAPAWRGGARRLLASQSIFVDRCPPLWVQGDAPETDLAGRLGYIGGGWVEPAWRRRGLIGIAVQLAQAYLLEHHRIDHAIGFVRPRHIPLALSIDGYSFEQASDAFAPYCAGTGFAEPLHLVHISRDSLARRFSGPAQYSLRDDPGQIPEIPAIPGRTPPLHEESASMRKMG